LSNITLISPFRRHPLWRHRARSEMGRKPSTQQPQASLSVDGICVIPCSHRDGMSFPDLGGYCHEILALGCRYLSTVLLCDLNGTAVLQTATGSATSLPSVTVVAPKQVARPPHRREQATNTGAVRRTAPATRTLAQTATRTPPPAPGSLMAKLKELERTSSNCTDGCQTSFKYGNQP
jgi:hypothetical protein